MTASVARHSGRMSFPALLREPGPVLTWLLLALAAFLEAYGDSCFQSALYRSTGAARLLSAGLGVLALGLYGWAVNLPRWDFGRLLGVYVVFFFYAPSSSPGCASTSGPRCRSAWAAP
ncbi:MAG: hypothetical protein QM757_03915 [Paludibaculum sp.]